MAVSYKDIGDLSQKSTLAGTEKLPVSDTQYITPNQIAGLVTGLPSVSSSDNGKILEVSSGAWAVGRKITISSSQPTSSDGSNGDIWIVV